jgi:hypothetical protein
MFFSVSCHISCPTMWFFFISSFVSFLAIFQVLQCVFHIFHVFQVSHHNPNPTVCVSHIPRFSVFLPYSRFYYVHFSFIMFFLFLAIFHVLQFVFHIF